jgi:Cytochrome b5-like Heme/Steroid binding domain
MFYATGRPYAGDMLSSLELPIFDTIAGLPVHILVVHLAVVILPIAAVGQALLVFVPAWRARWATPTLIGLVIGTGAAFVAKQSGEALAAHVGTPRTHAFWGDILPVVAAVLLVVAAAWWFLQRREAAGNRGALGNRGVGAPSVTLPTLLTGLLSAALAVAAAVITVLVGHTGAQAAWGGRIDGASSSASVAAAASSSSSSTKSTGSAPAAGALTLAAVQSHNTSSSCWSVINGNVYDLTGWIGQHPGGQSPIKQICGKDGTASFDGQHGGSNRVATDLATFKKGALVG